MTEAHTIVASSSASALSYIQVHVDYLGIFPFPQALKPIRSTIIIYASESTKRQSVTKIIRCSVITEIPSSQLDGH